MNLVTRQARRMSMYSADRHTLLPQVFLYRHGQNRVGYLIRQKDKVVSVDPGDDHALLQNIDTLQKNTGRKLQLEAVFLTDQSSQLEGDYAQVRIKKEGAEDRANIKYLREFETMQIGEVCMSMLESKGGAAESVVAMTHVTPTSCKIPLLFTGQSLLQASVGPCTCPSSLMASINRLKIFPNETLLFPSLDDPRQLVIANKLMPNNPVLKYKLDRLQQQPKQEHLPTSLPEEMASNPFYNLHNPSLQHLLEDTQPIRMFTKLVALQQAM